MLYLQIASPKSSVLNFLDSNSFEVIISIFQRTEKVPDMERLRYYFLYAIGYNWSKIEQESGIMIPVLSQSVEHKKAFCFGDVVKIYTRILYFNGVKIHFEYKFYSDSKDGIYALAETRHGFVDKELHPIMLQSVLRSEYDNIIGYMNAIE